jgi:hypothetical protein
MPIITTTKVLRPRDPHDHYPTPLDLCRKALREYAPTNYESRVHHIGDPGAGTGVWGVAARDRYPAADITGWELRDITAHSAYSTWIHGDYLSSAQTPMYDLICGNPPYALAEPFIRRALRQLQPGGTLIFLLRLAFLAGQARGHGLWRESPPVQVGVCSRRPSFTGNGKTDATDYAIFVWRAGWQGETTLGWLDWGHAPPAVLQAELLLEGVA